MTIFEETARLLIDKNDINEIEDIIEETFYKWLSNPDILRLGKDENLNRNLKLEEEIKELEELESSLKRQIDDGYLRIFAEEEVDSDWFHKLRDKKRYTVNHIKEKRIELKSLKKTETLFNNFKGTLNNRLALIINKNHEQYETSNERFKAKYKKLKGIIFDVHGREGMELLLSKMDTEEVEK